MDKANKCQFVIQIQMNSNREDNKILFIIQIRYRNQCTAKLHKSPMQLKTKLLHQRIPSRAKALRIKHWVIKQYNKTMLPQNRNWSRSTTIAFWMDLCCRARTTEKKSRVRTSSSCNSSRWTPRGYWTIRASMLGSISMSRWCRRRRPTREFWAMGKLEQSRGRIHRRATIRFRYHHHSTISNIHWRTVRQTLINNKWTRQNITNSSQKQSKKRKSLCKQVQKTQWRRARSYSINQATSWAS